MNKEKTIDDKFEDLIRTLSEALVLLMDIRAKLGGNFSNVKSAQPYPTIDGEEPYFIEYTKQLNLFDKKWLSEEVDGNGDPQ